MFKKNKKQSEKDTYLITSPDKKHGKIDFKKKYTATLEQTSNILLLVKMLKQST